MSGWSTNREYLDLELVQSRQEGRSTADLEQKWSGTWPVSDEELDRFYREILARPVVPDFPFQEPSDLPGIRALRSTAPVLAPVKGGPDLDDRFLGAWVGRCAGCALGLPIEGDPFASGLDGRPGWKNIELWFRGADAWPIQGYVPRESRATAEWGLDIKRDRTSATREELSGMVSDDDIRYTVLGLKLLEEQGDTWDTWDLGKFWHQHLPYALVCTAETQAYLNFAQATIHLNPHRPGDLTSVLETVRTWHNPYREWIGAQIRVDAYGYARAGDPEAAASLAWRDASFSHVKNGIYGAMFTAAMVAAAFCEPDPLRVVQAGLAQIPRTSRLHRDVCWAVELAQKTSSELDLVDQLEQHFRGYHWIHTNPNAALVAASLVFGKGDFERALTTSVLGGWDTDCNGATVGSIAGAMVGTKGIPLRWSEPLKDTVESLVPGFHPISIRELARRSGAVYQKLNG